MLRLRRKIDDYLLEWKNSVDKKPLIVTGARQIGKTDAIRNFGEKWLTQKIFKRKIVEIQQNKGRHEMIFVHDDLFLIFKGCNRKKFKLYKTVLWRI